jgi:hypothetical protein
VTFAVEIDREEDGRWIAEVPALPGVLAYGRASLIRRDASRPDSLSARRKPQKTLSEIIWK